MQTVAYLSMCDRNILFITKYTSFWARARRVKNDLLFRELSKHGSIFVITQREPGICDPRPNIKNVHIQDYKYPGYSLRSIYYKFKSKRAGRQSGNFAHEKWSFIRTIKNSIGGALSRLGAIVWPDAYVLSVPRAVYIATRYLRKYRIDIMVASCYPFSNLLSGLIIKSLRNDLKWIVEMRDPYANNPSVRRNLLGQYIANKFEKIVFSNADLIWYYKGWLPGGSGYFRTYSEAIQAKAIELPVCGYDDRIFMDCESIRENRGEHSFKMIHAGNFYGGEHSPKILFDAIRILRDEKSWPEGATFELYGGLHGVSIDPDLKDIVRHHGYVPYESMGNILCDGNLLVWLSAPLGPYGREYSDNIPSKVFDYIGSCIPVLAILPDGPAREFSIKNGIGYVVYPRIDDVVNGLRKILILYNNGGLGLSQIAESGEHVMYSSSMQVKYAAATIENICRDLM